MRPAPLLPALHRVHMPVMEQTSRLYADLQQRRPDDAAWTRLYDSFVARLATLKAGHRAPRPGTAFPDLHLPDHVGRYRSLASIRAGQPMIVSFVRGNWCAYCRGELEDWRQQIDSLDAAGGRLVIIVGEISGGADRIHDLLGGKALVLCDVDHGAALDLGLAYHAGPDLLLRYLDAGLDLRDVYGTDSGILPIPATFLIDGAGLVRTAHVDPDFRVRARPEEQVAALARL